MYHLMHAGITPANGHSGFHRIEVSEKPNVKSGDYFHYLHHRYFDCNYGTTTVPLDRWVRQFPRRLAGGARGDARPSPADQAGQAEVLGG